MHSRIGWALGVWLIAAGAARADEAGDQLAALVDKVAPSIVTVKVVLKTEVAMRGEVENDESRMELTGVVVDADGLVMISSTAIANPLEGGGGTNEQFQTKITPTDIKVIFERDEKECEAFLAATDSKLGLAFVKVEDLAGRKIAAVEFANAAEPRRGQPVASVGRQNKGFDFAPYFETARVSGEIAKPRRAWLIDGTVSSLGLPVYGLEGQVLGVLTQISSGMKDEDESGAGALVCVLPGSVVKGVVEQSRKKAAEVAEERAKQKKEKGPAGDGKGKDEGKDDKGEKK